MQVVKALVDFADKKAGDIFYAYTVPRDWAGFSEAHAGKLYITIYDKTGNVVTYLIEDDQVEAVTKSLDDIMSLPIVYTEPGAQDQDDMYESLGLESHRFDWSRCSEFESRFTSAFTNRWLCTDTYVGYGFLRLDGENVALFSQTARKNDCNFTWLSVDAKHRAHNVAKSFYEDDGFDNNDILKPDENLASFYYASSGA